MIDDNRKRDDGDPVTETSGYSDEDSIQDWLTGDKGDECEDGLYIRDDDSDACSSNTFVSFDRPVPKPKK
jgi:hypothetical protein